MPVEVLRLQHYVDIFGARCVDCEEEDGLLMSTKKEKQRGAESNDGEKAVKIDWAFWNAIRDRKKKQQGDIGAGTLARDRYTASQKQ